MDFTHPGRTIHTQLLNAMKSGEYAHSNSLPPESVLSELLGISRTQLRDILATLEREGFITRRHGVGTIINRHVLDLPTRMDIEVEFLDMIRQSGFEAAVAFVRTSEDTADATVASQLNIPVGTPVLRISRLCTADGRPAIYCEDIIEKAKVSATCDETSDLPFFHFLKEACGITPYLDLSDLHPAVADQNLSQLFQVPLGTPLLNIAELDFDIDGHPVFCSNQYFVDGIIRLTVLRKKL